MQKRKSGGFTLVELVVVIAVLAILAGVGVVAYNGYIDYANKGVDRDLVGEIIHAIDVASYSNPNSTGSAMIILTTDGAPKILGSASEEVKAALTDAFGNLDSIRLKFDKWGNPIPADFNTVVTGIKENETVQTYLNNIEAKGASSFAGNVDEIWDIVSTLVNGLNGKGEMLGFTFSGPIGEGDYLDKIVTRTTSADSTAIKNAWTSNGKFTLYEPDPTDPSKNRRATSTELGVMLTRNYAFYLYAKTHPSLTEDMKEDLEKLRVQGTYDYFEADFAENNEAWQKIINEYKTSNRAEQDVQAFLALMQAANQVKAGGALTDDDYLEAMSGYIPVVGPILSGDISLDDLTDIDYNLSGIKDGVMINVKSVDGLLTVPSNGVVSNEADPRDIKEAITYAKSTETLNFSDGEPRTANKIITLSSTDSEHKSCKLTMNYGGMTQNLSDGTVSYSVEGLVTFDATTNTVTVTGSGTGTVQISVKIKDFFNGNVTYQFTVRVC